MRKNVTFKNFHHNVGFEGKGIMIWEYPVWTPDPTTTEPTLTVPADSTASNTGPPINPKKEIKWWFYPVIIVSIVVAIMFITAIACLFVKKNKNKPKKADSLDEPIILYSNPHLTETTTVYEPTVSPHDYKPKDTKGDQGKTIQ